MHPATRPSENLHTHRNSSLWRAGGWLAVLALLLGAAPPSSQPVPTAQGVSSQLVREVTRARVIDLTHTWDEFSPIAGVNPRYSFSLTATHSHTRNTFGDNGQLSFTSELMEWSGQHGAPSIDAIGHIGHNGRLHGGVDAAAASADPRGLGRSGVGAELAIDAFPRELLANRGVLLDVARYLQGTPQPLPAGFEITAQHLKDTAAAQKVDLQPGDTVFIRTGWGQYFQSSPDFYKGDSSPGPGLDAARYLVEKGARIVGADTLTFEKRPAVDYSAQFQVFPVHLLLLPGHGIYIIENLLLEELAEARAYEFVAVVPPLKVRGGTGSALRAFALVNLPGGR